jgi:hypothetical protein
MGRQLTFDIIHVPWERFVQYASYGTTRRNFVKEKMSCRDILCVAIHHRHSQRSVGTFCAMMDQMRDRSQ